MQARQHRNLCGIRTQTKISNCQRATYHAAEPNAKGSNLHDDMQ